jgi:DNA-binding response OmpR family regulator
MAMPCSPRRRARRRWRKSGGLQLGADWYLIKPFAPGDISTVVRRFLHGRRWSAPASPGEMARMPMGEIDRRPLAAPPVMDGRHASDARYGCETGEEALVLR